MRKITPSEYLKSAMQGFKVLPADVCDHLLKTMHNSEGVWGAVYIPESIPQKYHARMQATWTVMAFKILFAKAVQKYTLMQRHKMLCDALEHNKMLCDVLKNVGRESAGR